MRKLSLICDCGQRMMVPESAIGQTGLCPNCGVEIDITAKNTRPYKAARRSGGLMVKARRVKEEPKQSKQSWREFAAAVDLYSAQRYAESLAILGGLLERHPDNPNVQVAIEQCMKSLQESTAEGRTYAREAVDLDSLNPEIVKSVILDKMTGASDDAIQLQAANMAAHILGLYGKDAKAPEVQLDDLPNILLRRAGSNGKHQSRNDGHQPIPRLPKHGHIKEEIS